MIMKYIVNIKYNDAMNFLFSSTLKYDTKDNAKYSNVTQ